MGLVVHCLISGIVILNGFRLLRRSQSSPEEIDRIMSSRPRAALWTPPYYWISVLFRQFYEQDGVRAARALYVICGAVSILVGFVFLLFFFPV